ncbi:hypothetical protein BDR26DRAFT_857830 [Obelidium mucronatum]|nr:hypothetical protein BDR26DRAFT_857830 [Obelidium mucronatum]
MPPVSSHWFAAQRSSRRQKYLFLGFLFCELNCSILSGIASVSAARLQERCIPFDSRTNEALEDYALVEGLGGSKKDALVGAVPQRRSSNICLSTIRHDIPCQQISMSANHLPLTPARGHQRLDYSSELCPQCTLCYHLRHSGDCDRGSNNSFEFV